MVLFSATLTVPGARGHFMAFGDQEALQRLHDILKTAYELKWLGIV